MEAVSTEYYLFIYFRTDNLLQSIVGTKRPATSVDVEEENEEPKTKKIKSLPDDTG